jgi:hypothetical protein
LESEIAKRTAEPSRWGRTVRSTGFFVKYVIPVVVSLNPARCPAAIDPEITIRSE